MPSTSFQQPLFAAILGLLLAGAPAVGSQSSAPSFSVLVTGEVRYPGRVVLTAATMTVADALAAVGSPTRNAGDEVVVIRAGEFGGVGERFAIALKAMDAGLAEAALPLRDGDIVNVPAAKRYFISGLVLRPGAYKLQIGTTVSQAIILAGGLLSGGSNRRIRIARVVKGKPSEIAAQPDDIVLPEDEIRIGRRMF